MTATDRPTTNDEGATGKKYRQSTGASRQAFGLNRAVNALRAELKREEADYDPADEALTTAAALAVRRIESDWAALGHRKRLGEAVAVLAWRGAISTRNQETRRPLIALVLNALGQTTNVSKRVSDVWLTLTTFDTTPTSVLSVAIKTAGGVDQLVRNGDRQKLAARARRIAREYEAASPAKKARVLRRAHPDSLMTVRTPKK